MYYRVTIDVKKWPGDEHPDLWEWSELLDLPREYVRYVEAIEHDGDINEESNDDDGA